MIFNFYYMLVMPTGLLVQCTAAFPGYDVVSHLFYGAVFIASVVWLSPTRSSGYVQYQQLRIS